MLEGVRWVGPPLRSKGCAARRSCCIDYATWCPKCNKWSGEVCKQIKESIADKPVVVLAINNDETPGNVKPYLEARDFLAPNIVHGYDPADRQAKRPAGPLGLHDYRPRRERSSTRARSAAISAAMPIRSSCSRRRSKNRPTWASSP